MLANQSRKVDLFRLWEEVEVTCIQGQIGVLPWCKKYFKGNKINCKPPTLMKLRLPPRLTGKVNQSIASHSLFLSFSIYRPPFPFKDIKFTFRTLLHLWVYSSLPPLSVHRESTVHMKSTVLRRVGRRKSCLQKQIESEKQNNNKKTKPQKQQQQKKPRKISDSY